MTIEIFLDVGYIISQTRLSCLQLLKNMGVAANRPHPLYEIAPRAVLVKVF